MAQIKDSELMKKMMMFARKARRRDGMPGRDFPKSPHGHGPHPGECIDATRKHADGDRNPAGCPGIDHRPPAFFDGRPMMPPMEERFRRPPLSREHLLVTIGEYPDGVRQKVLAEKFGINQSSASELIGKLESDGYLKRTTDPTDKRATLLFLTELGQARAAEVEDEREAAFAELFCVLTDEEKEALSNILDKLLAKSDQ